MMSKVQTRRACRRQAHMEEGLMELLVDKELNEDRIPHDGELEGSGMVSRIKLFLAVC
jgi:hypothetical protein